MKQAIRNMLMVTAIGAVMVPTWAQAEQFVFVENSRSGNVSVISAPEHKLVDIIPDLPRPDDVIASPDGKTIYVDLVKDKMGHALREGNAGEVVAIDSKTRKVKWRIAIDDGMPNHMAISRDGMLYVPLFDRAYVVIIDTHKRKIVGHLDAFWGMHSMQISDDNERLYAGSMFTQSLYVFDLKKRKLETIIDFKDGVRPLQVSKDEKVLYAQRSRYHGIDVVDLDQGKVVKSVDLPPMPDDFVVPTRWPHNVDHGLGLSPDQKYLLAAGSSAGYVAVYTHPDLQFVKTIPVGSEPNWITFGLDSKYAYVGCRGDNVVSVIDMETLTESARVKTGGEGSARLIVADVPDE